MKRCRIYIAICVLAKWIALIGNLVLMTVLTVFLAELYEGHAETHAFIKTALVSIGVLLVRFAMHLLEAKMRFLCIKTMKITLREQIYTKLLRLGTTYKEQVSVGGLLQDTVEGVDQLEHYYGTLLPDFFYGMLATLTLFGYLFTIQYNTAVFLLLGTACIPFAIAAARTLTQKAYSQYWDRYKTVSNTFLENLRGLTTLKIYQADHVKYHAMKADNEELRKMGMKVALIRLDAITVMDFIACAGTALGVVLAISGLMTGRLVLDGCLHILVLSAEFFLPMRTMGEHFHHAMKGRVAGGKIRKLLSLQERKKKDTKEPKFWELSCTNLRFSYDGRREILQGVTMQFPVCSLTAIVGESGCGKSTLADILMDRHTGYVGQVLAGGIPLTEIAQESVMRHITYVGHQPHFFHATVAENLRLAKPHAADEELWQVLDRVHIGDALRRRQGLNTVMEEQDIHLSGGQLQRISIARAILHDSPVYIFDEATSNMDGESERYAMEQIYGLAKNKTVVLISHHLSNVMKADRIYVMEQGTVVQSGTHEALLGQAGLYRKLWHVQHCTAYERNGGDPA